MPAFSSAAFNSFTSRLSGSPFPPTGCPPSMVTRQSVPFPPSSREMTGPLRVGLTTGETDRPSAAGLPSVHTANRLAA